MKLITLLIILFLFSGCKTENVEFGTAESTPLKMPDTGLEAPTPEPEPEPEPTPQGPVVIIHQKPNDHYYGESTQFAFETKKGDFEISSVECFVDGQELPCFQSPKVNELGGFGLGPHQVSVVVEDDEGLQGEASASWVVSESFKTVIDPVEIDNGGNKADILFVIDNSGSMEEEQAEVARRISKFLQKIEKLNWRIGIITTDPYRVEPKNGAIDPYADGVLLRFPNGKYFLESSLSQKEARGLFMATIRRREFGNGHERGIRNTYRSVERAMSSKVTPENTQLKNFFREKASFSVVLISDEDETTEDSKGKPLAELAKSDGKNLLKFIKTSFGPQKIFQWNSVIVRPGDNSCISKDEKFGMAYYNLSKDTGGVVEDICADDYSGALRKIGAGVANLQRKYTLKCVPQDSNSNGKVEFTVKRIKGLFSIPSYQLNGDQLTFSRPLKPGKYEFRYSCLSSIPN